MNRVMVTITRIVRLSEVGGCRPPPPTPPYPLANASFLNFVAIYTIVWSAPQLVPERTVISTNCGNGGPIAERGTLIVEHGSLGVGKCTPIVEKGTPIVEKGALTV